MEAHVLHAFRAGLTRMPDGRALVTLRAEWHDGTTRPVFGPFEPAEKLAAVTPRPRMNLTVYQGMLAPHARWRDRVVATVGGTRPNPRQLRARPRRIRPRNAATECGATSCVARLKETSLPVRGVVAECSLLALVIAHQMPRRRAGAFESTSFLLGSYRLLS